MLTKRNAIIHSFSLCLLVLGFLLSRYVFFGLHGMKQFPQLLFLAGSAAICISFVLKGRTAPLFISLAYSIGFFAGLIFSTEGTDAGGGKTDNMWIIWVLVFAAISLVGATAEKVKAKK